MRIYISVDMEGLSGVVSWSQVEVQGGEEYRRSCRLLAAEVNAAASGALAAGATAILVNDAHNHMRNLWGEALLPRVQLISGSAKGLGMMEGIDRTFQAAFFLGYHARAGSPGILAHTCNETILSCRINGQEMGETGLNALVAGYYGVPVAFLSGDNIVAVEAKKLLGNLEIVIVKEARGSQAARCLAPAVAWEKIKAAAGRAVKNVTSYKPLKPPRPAVLEVEFKETGQAEMARLVPGSRRRSPRVVVYEHNDYLNVYRAFRAMAGLAKHSP
ncbi:MAG: M55 family metallopeptidase [Thermoanaerobacteraceae bacterium]|nr:M55 family metallopeptidase [Thermoanaerobacteraceae bacterium]